MADEREAFLNHGWRQFSILRSNDHESLCEFCHFDAIQDHDLLLVTSQTCDLVNSVDKEPYIEVVCLRRLSNEPAKLYQYGRNSRRFELTLSIDGKNNHFYMLAHERFPIRHILLKDLKPFYTIEDTLLQDNLRQWIAARYDRTAFPDKFVDRLRPQMDKVEKCIKKLKLVNSIYVRLSSFEELSSSDEYSIDLLLVMNPEHFEDTAKYNEYDQYRKELEGHIEKCTGITVDSAELTTYDKVTVAELQEYAKWDYSYLSYRDPEEHALPK